MASVSRQHGLRGSNTADTASHQPNHSNAPPLSVDQTDTEQTSQSEGVLSAQGSQVEPGFVRRLFDKELDNQHEEGLLLSQLAACQLKQAVRRDMTTDFAQRVAAWAGAAAEVGLIPTCISYRMVGRHQSQGLVVSCLCNPVAVKQTVV